MNLYYKYITSSLREEKKIVLEQQKKKNCSRGFCRSSESENEKTLKDELTLEPCKTTENVEDDIIRIVDGFLNSENNM